MTGVNPKSIQTLPAFQFRWPTSSVVRPDGRRGSGEGNRTLNRIEPAARPVGGREQLPLRLVMRMGTKLRGRSNWISLELDETTAGHQLNARQSNDWGAKVEQIKSILARGLAPSDQGARSNLIAGCKSNLFCCVARTGGGRGPARLRVDARNQRPRRGDNL